MQVLNEQKQHLVFFFPLNMLILPTESMQECLREHSYVAAETVSTFLFFSGSLVWRFVGIFERPMDWEVL